MNVKPELSSNFDDRVTSANSRIYVARSANNTAQGMRTGLIMKSRNKGPQAPPVVTNSLDLGMCSDDSFNGPERASSLGTSFMGKRLKKRVVLRRPYQRGGSVNQNASSIVKSLA